MAKAKLKTAKDNLQNVSRQMNEPYRIRTAVAPEPLSRDEVKEYFERKARNHAVNPERYSARIMKR